MACIAVKEGEKKRGEVRGEEEERRRAKRRGLQTLEDRERVEA
jgi:hypothetical protein